MSNDTIEVTISGDRKVVIRNYTTRADDNIAARILNDGVTMTTAGESDEPQISISMQATRDSEAKYVELLTQSIDGKTEDIPYLLNALRSEDYEAIAVAVRSITSVPKARSTSKS